MKTIQFIKENKRKIIIGIFWIIIITGVILILPTKDKFTCPEDFPSIEAQISELSEYLSKAKKLHPNFTVKELVELRDNDLRKNNCLETLNNMALYDEREINKEKSGGEVNIPSITADENYSKNFLTFSNELFSFKYPDYLTVVSDSDFSGTIIVPKDYETKTTYPFIVITPQDNIGNSTPEEWLTGPDSGFNYSSPYYKTKIDGQEAVYADGGMMIVVNTPDNKHRLVIVDDPSDDGSRMFTEMGIVFESLVFTK